MALPLVGLAARAAASLAKNKKMREALTKSAGGFLKRRQKLTPSQKAATGFPGGLAVGAGASTVIMDKKLQKEKKKTKSSKSQFDKKMESGQRKSKLQRKNK